MAGVLIALLLVGAGLAGIELLEVVVVSLFLLAPEAMFEKLFAEPIV